MLRLEETKLHLRIDHDEEDVLIDSLIDTAKAAVANYLDNATLVLDYNTPAPVKAAALLLVSDLYENRSAQNDRALYVNSAYERLLNPYRVMTA